MSRSRNWKRGANNVFFVNHGESFFRSGSVYSTSATVTCCTVRLAYVDALALSDRNSSHAVAAGCTLEAALTPRMKVALYVPS